jgi:hypothetical protein
MTAMLLLLSMGLLVKHKINTRIFKVISKYGIKTHAKDCIFQNLGKRLSIDKKQLFPMENSVLF